MGHDDFHFKFCNCIKFPALLDMAADNFMTDERPIGSRRRVALSKRFPEKCRTQVPFIVTARWERGTGAANLLWREAGCCIGEGDSRGVSFFLQCLRLCFHYNSF